MFGISSLQVGEEVQVTRDEARLFVSDVLKESLPDMYPPSLDWINHLIQAFHTRLPFQNITLLCKTDNYHVPTWEDIQRDILKEGKGGLCLSLNVAFAAILRSFGVHAHLIPGDYVATKGRSVHALTVFHLCTATTQNACLCFDVEKSRIGIPSLCRDSVRKSPRLKHKRTDETMYNPQLMKIICKEFLQRNSLYMADVGCGFPTLRAINLSEDIEKPFIDCSHEYCFTKKRQNYQRLHRAGDEIPKGEEERG